MTFITLHEVDQMDGCTFEVFIPLATVQEVAEGNDGKVLVTFTTRSIVVAESMGEIRRLLKSAGLKVLP